MEKLDMKSCFGVFSTKTVQAMVDLKKFNMFNTTTSMWVDDGFVFYFDAIRPEWTASEVTK